MICKKNKAIVTNYKTFTHKDNTITIGGFSDELGNQDIKKYAKLSIYDRLKQSTGTLEYVVFDTKINC